MKIMKKEVIKMDSDFETAKGSSQRSLAVH